MQIIAVTERKIERKILYSYSANSAQLRSCNLYEKKDLYGTIKLEVIQRILGVNQVNNGNKNIDHEICPNCLMYFPFALGTPGLPIICQEKVKMHIKTPYEEELNKIF